MPKPVTVVSGDRAARVQSFCQPLGLAWHAPATPDQKLAVLLEAQKTAPVLALGDGINDASLLAAADASIALTDASELTRSRCDALVLGQSLMTVPKVLHLARKTRRIVRQNLFWAISYNASVLPLAASGWLPAWAAALGMSASSLLVVFNAMRLNR